MITNKKINDWLKKPEDLKNLKPNLLEQYAKDFPYFNILQYLQALSHDTKQWNAVSLRHPINPVLKYILKAKYQQEYPTSFDYNFANSPIATTVIPSDTEAITEALTEALIIESPQQEYFKLEGLKIPDDIQNDWSNLAKHKVPTETPEQSLMVVMPFSEWLKYLSKLSIKEKAEEESKKSLRALWQKEKLASALEEETDEIPEDVFEMAVNSISKQEDIVNESLAEVYVRQEKYQKAIDIYIKLSLLYPEKNTYFASKVEKLKKEL